MSEVKDGDVVRLEVENGVQRWSVNGQECPAATIPEDLRTLLHSALPRPILTPDMLVPISAGASVLLPSAIDVSDDDDNWKF